MCVTADALAALKQFDDNDLFCDQHKDNEGLHLGTVGDETSRPHPPWDCVKNHLKMFITITFHMKLNINYEPIHDRVLPFTRHRLLTSSFMLCLCNILCTMFD